MSKKDRSLLLLSKNSWIDSKHAATIIGVSNQKLLKKLDDEKITFKSGKYRSINNTYKGQFRSVERSWIAKDAVDYSSVQYYAVVQVNESGVDFCRQLFGGRQ